MTTWAKKLVASVLQTRGHTHPIPQEQELAIADAARKATLEECASICIHRMNLSNLPWAGSPEHTAMRRNELVHVEIAIRALLDSE